MSSQLLSDLPGVSQDKRVAGTVAAQMEAQRDANLVRRFTGGDESAFDEIVSRHRDRIFSLVRGCLPNRADVEEVVDDTFIRAYRGLAHFRGESSLATWLHHIAINLARNRYWFLLRRRHLASSFDATVSEETSGSVVDFVPSGSPDPAQELDQKEFSAVVTECMDRLPARHRDVLRLRTLLDTSYADIAVAVGINVGTVKSRIARARRLLQQGVNAIAPEPPIRSTPAF